jgi:hypothetical protein
VLFAVKSKTAFVFRRTPGHRRLLSITEESLKLEEFQPPSRIEPRTFGSMVRSQRSFFIGIPFLASFFGGDPESMIGRQTKP